MEAQAVRRNRTITVTLDGRFNDLKICMRNVGRIEHAEGAEIEDSKSDVFLRVKSNTVIITI